MPDILQCPEPSKPVMECFTTPVYGVPRLRANRTVYNSANPMVDTPIQGIAVHCINDTYNGYINKSCVGYTKKPPACLASMHYVIDSETGMIASLVEEEKVAWAWQSYVGNFPITYPTAGCVCPIPCDTTPCPDPNPPEQITYPGWTVLEAANPNISADFYTINIGITNVVRPEQIVLDGVDCCNGPYGLSEIAYTNLVHLIAWIQSRYPAILLDTQHIAFHDEIVNIVEEECKQCKCPGNVCLVCDVSDWCENCFNKGDPGFVQVTELRYLYGESSSGCKVKIHIDDLRVLLGL